MTTDEFPPSAPEPPQPGPQGLEGASPTPPRPPVNVVELERQVQSLKRSVTVLTVALVCVALVPCALFAISLQGFFIPAGLSLAQEIVPDLVPGSGPDQTGAIEDELKGAWGSDISGLSVNRTPGWSSFDDEPSYDIVFRVGAANATIACSVYDADELGEDGLVPGSGFDGELPKQDYVAILRAWGARSRNPVVGVMSYADNEFDEDEPSYVTIGGRTYDSNTLWEVMSAETANVEIFQLDRTAHVATYVGSGDADNWGGADGPTDSD